MVSTIQWLLVVFPQHCTLLGKGYTFRDKFNLATTILSPCGADTVVIIGGDIQTDNAANTTGSGYIAVDTVRLISVLSLLRTLEADHFFPYNSRPLPSSNR